MKKFYILLLIVFVLTVTACGGMKDNSELGSNIDGVSFDYFETYTIEETDYEVYLPTMINESMYYEYELGDVVSTSANWTINFIYDVNYHIDNKKEPDEVWNQLYLILLNGEATLEEKTGSDLTIFNPFSEVELEYVLSNETQQEASYVIFYTYLPLRLINTTTRKRTTIGLPVMVDVLLKIDDMVQNPFTNEMMLWGDFLAIENL